MSPAHTCSRFCFFMATATPEIYTLSLHDALPIYRVGVTGGQSRRLRAAHRDEPAGRDAGQAGHLPVDRKSTRLNSSHANISYAVFCLKKKKTTQARTRVQPAPPARAPPSRSRIRP